MRPLAYLLSWTGLFVGLLSLWLGGWAAFLLPLYVFGLIPLLELFLPPDAQNLSPEAEQAARNHPVYDWLLWLIVPMQYGMLACFFWVMQEPGQTWYSLVGRTFSMGIACGVYGINAAHELGHRSRRGEQWLSRMLLLTSLYMHFFIEHNRGHHKHVSTPHDPASARYGEMLYLFWLRSIRDSWRSAWRLENDRVRKQAGTVWTWRNEMILITLVQAAFTGAVFVLAGPAAGIGFLGAALTGILLLETVNYIEHYGLQRRLLPAGYYEKVMPVHSWNSDHVLGRWMLFELSRHSDHHYHAGRKYQVLRHFDESPQMPAGYPGMMLLSLVPPLWFAVMNPRVKALQQLAA